MTKAKHVAKSLKSILDLDIMNGIIDRKFDIIPIIKEVESYWDYDLYSRKPGPAYTSEGVFQGTDLDLSTFLYSLKNRGAVVNIPEYKSLRNNSLKEGQLITSKDNRHGKIIGLTSNKDSFIFSLKILDQNVITTNSVGDYRNFSLTDFSGNWYDGWQEIQFLPNKDENKFITENKLWSENKVIFKNFVAPGRWTSVFGQYYFISKSLLQRITEECEYYYSCMKRMLENGINYLQMESSYDDKPKIQSVKEKGKSIKVECYHFEVDLPENKTTFPEYEDNQNNLIMLSNKRKDLLKIKQEIQFALRASELSFVKYGIDKFPAWIQNAKWEEFKIKRTMWNRLVLFQPDPFKFGVSLRYRKFDKSEIVSENYKI